MFVNPNKNRIRMVDAAIGRIPCDLSLENAKLVNVITGEIYDAAVDIIDGIIVRDRVVKICDTIFPCIDDGFGENKPVDVVIRPEDLIIGKPGQGHLDGEVVHNVFQGVHYEMEIEAGGFLWLAQNTTSYPVGTKVSLDVEPENIQIMHKPKSEGEEAIEIDV